MVHLSKKQLNKFGLAVLAMISIAERRRKKHDSTGDHTRILTRCSKMPSNVPDWHSFCAAENTTSMLPRTVLEQPATSPPSLPLAGCRTNLTFLCDLFVLVWCDIPGKKAHERDVCIGRTAHTINWASGVRSDYQLLLWS